MIRLTTEYEFVFFDRFIGLSTTLVQKPEVQVRTNFSGCQTSSIQPERHIVTPDFVSVDSKPTKNYNNEDRDGHCTRQLHEQTGHHDYRAKCADICAMFCHHVGERE